MSKNSRRKKSLIEDNGFYEFDDKTTIRVFADLEGMMPKEIANLIKNEDLMKKQEVIVFTGDLIDRGPKSIQNLIDMYSLKTKNPKNVILTCGNRDLNKIRCYKEFCVKEIEEILVDKKNKSKNIEEIFSLVKKIPKCTFKYKATDIRNDINFQGIVDERFRSDFDEIYSDDLQKRIDFIYRYTFRAPHQIKYFRKEYGKTFRINLNKNENLYKFITMMNMVMGRIYDIGSLPNCLNEYNGLYIEYLLSCHIIAKITIGGKMIFASHSGIPFKNNDFKIPKLLGREIKNDDKIVIDNIPRLNNELCLFLNKFRKVDSLYSSSNLNEYKRFIAMTSSSGIRKIPMKVDSELSPIVTIRSLKDKGPFMYRNKPINVESNHTHYYNIFGHQPCGFLPGASRTINKKTTYHIDLDISRAENPQEIANNESYVYLEITKYSDKLFGKTTVIIDKEHQSREIYNITKIEENQIKNINKFKINQNINIPQYQIDLDKYIDNFQKVAYNIAQNGEKTNNVLVPLYSVDGANYYGMCSHNWHLLKYTTKRFVNNKRKS